MVGGRRASDRNFASDLKLEHEYAFVYILEFETRLIEISLAGETDRRLIIFAEAVECVTCP